MTQDTRKDKRAKIVSLNVRYKSATVDEFIENHSHDVSKGGIFIKTPTPFAPGTLIKFEIRILGDKAVIAGVGRVVWKRESGTASGERPAGMGVKFIKIDEASRQIIDRIVAEKEDAGGAYESEGEADASALEKAASIPAPPLDAKLTPRPVGTGGDRGAGPQHKATMMGLGIGATPPAGGAPRGEPPLARPAAGAPAMFPTTNSEKEMPPKQERTVMKQAAELLEEALKEAGGSMDDIGTNPLFGGGSERGPAAARSGPAPIIEPPAEAPKSTLIGIPAARDHSQDAIEVPKTQSTPPEALKREALTAAAVAKSVPPEGARDASAAKQTAGASLAEEPSSSRQRKTEPPARRSAADAVAAPPKKKGGAGAILWILAIAVVGGGVAFLYKQNLAPSETPTVNSATATPVTPPATASAPPAIAPAPSASAETAEGNVADAALARADAGTTAETQGAAAGSARPTGAKPAATATTAAPTATTPAARPTPTPPAPKPTPAATSTAAPAGGAETAAPTAAPAPPPRPKPKPKSPAPEDTSDNPY